MTGAEFKAIRESMGYTQERIAQCMGCTVNNIYKTEKQYRGREVSGLMAAAMRLLKENYELRNEVMGYRTGDKAFARKSGKLNRLQELRQMKALAEEQIRLEGDSIAVPRGK